MFRYSVNAVTRVVNNTLRVYITLRVSTLSALHYANITQNCTTHIRAPTPLPNYYNIYICRGGQLMVLFIVIYPPPLEAPSHLSQERRWMDKMIDTHLYPHGP